LFTTTGDIDTSAVAPTFGVGSGSLSRTIGIRVVSYNPP
jgi:hypothetical protein